MPTPEERYRRDARQVLAALGRAVATLARVMERPQPASGGWRDELRSALGDVRTHCVRLTELEPPVPLGEVHQRLLTTATTFEDVSQEVERGIESGDVESFARAHAALARGCQAVSGALADLADGR